MRKFAIVIIIGLVILSCEHDSITIQVINNSDYAVTFTFDDYHQTTYTLNPQTSASYTKHVYKPYIQRYSATPPRVVYKVDYDTNVVTFYNTPGKEIKIVNNLDREVLVSANGCMAIEPITVPRNSEVPVTIYAVNPEFTGVTASDNFPVKFTVSTDDQSVIIHWE